MRIGWLFPHGPMRLLHDSLHICLLFTVVFSRFAAFMLRQCICFYSPFLPSQFDLHRTTAALTDMGIKPGMEGLEDEPPRQQQQQRYEQVHMAI